MFRKISYTALMFVALLAISGCGGGGPKEDPITTLKRKLMNYPEFAVTLQDMQEQGSFSKKYMHKYHIVYSKTEQDAKAGIQTTEDSPDWVQVDPQSYKKLIPYLGMTILSKKLGGEMSTTPQPPGYMFVGDPRYGNWTGPAGNQTWSWLPAFSMFAAGITMSNFMDFDRHHRSHKPYFGSNKQYGTNGSLTKKSYPGFYSRQMGKIGTKKADFANKAKSKFGQFKTGTSGMSRSSGSSSSSFRSRSSSGGGK